MFPFKSLEKIGNDNIRNDLVNYIYVEYVE